MYTHIFIDAENVPPQKSMVFYYMACEKYKVNLCDVVGNVIHIPKIMQCMEKPSFRIWNSMQGKNSADLWLATLCYFSFPSMRIIDGKDFFMLTNRKRIVPGLCLGAVLLLLALIGLEGKLPQVLVYNGTASVDVGWYLLIPPKDIAEGDMVIFTLPDDTQELAEERGWLPEGTRLLKQVGATEGGVYGVNVAHQFYVNEKYLGQASTEDGLGRNMPYRAIGVHVVEAGSFLPVGANPKSFDGRYYGTVSLDRVEHKAVLVLPTGWLKGM